MQGDVGAGSGEGGGGDGVVEADGEVEWGFAVGVVAAVEGEGDFVGDSFLGQRVGLGADLGRVGEPGQGGDDAGEGSVIACGDGVVDRAVLVVFGFYRRR